MATVSSVREALSNCAETPSWAVGMCGQFCAAMYGYGASGYVDAVAQWQQTPSTLRHASLADAPAGGLLFWGGGSQGHGHVAIADGQGSCWSIDIGGPGTVSRVTAGTINARWGLPFLGWTAPYFQGEQWEPVSIYGVDVSAYQPINFLLTTPGDSKRVDFAIIKVTESTNWLSARWTGQQMWARDHDLAVGYYHFARPGNMIAQADYFLAQLGNLAPGESLWFDWEDSGVTSTQKDQWIKYVQSKRPGFRVGLYCNTTFWKTKDTSSFAGDGLWIATGGYAAGTPPIQSAWLIHQYSTTGNYDHDLAQFATKADMIDWAGGDVALSADDKAWITAQIKTIPKAVLTADDIIPSANDASNHATNPFWTLSSWVADIGNGAHSDRVKLAQAVTALADVQAQGRTTGSGVTALATSLTAVSQRLDAAIDILEGIDLSQLPEEIATKLNGLRFVLQEGS
jgi:hypothetical protein